MPYHFLQTTMKGRINTTYVVSHEKYYKHRAILIPQPRWNMTGEYTCNVQTFESSDKKSAFMQIIGKKKKRAYCMGLLWRWNSFLPHLCGSLFSLNLFLPKKYHKSFSAVVVTLQNKQITLGSKERVFWLGNTFFLRWHRFLNWM